MLVLHARDDVLARGEANDALGGIGGRTAFVVELANRRDHCPHHVAALCVDDDAIAGAKNGVGREIVEEGLGAADR
jgi:hypothetical protein